jgi:predicted esterase
MTINEIMNNLKGIIDDDINISYRHNDNLHLSKQIYQLEKNNITKFECNSFIIYKYEVLLKNNKVRSYLVKIPKHPIQYETIKKCIMFFHGSRDLHWEVALLSTNMLSKDFITIYLQGNNQGEYNLEEPHIHEGYGYITYGENFFEIRENVPNFNEDIEYIKLVKEDVIQKYKFIDFYAIGHSNGGVFVCLFPIYLPNEFKALVSHQGGIGWDEWFNISFEKLDVTSIKPSIYFYTGTEDIHKIPCIQAHKLFTNEGFDSKLYIEDGLTHTWKKYHEDTIYEYLLQH